MRAAIRLPRALLIWLLVAGLSTAALVISAWLFFPAVARAKPVQFTDIAGVRSDTHIDLGPVDERSYVYDRNGQVLAVLRAEVNREIVPLDAIAPIAQKAVISAEDKNFFTHHGFDMRGALRAAVVDIAGGGISQGGSTITQQVIKNSQYGSAERKLRAKVNEALLAVRLEDQLEQEGRKRGDPLFHKNEILTRYLNTVYLGNDAYGIEAGAETYFSGKKAKDLTLAESALLASFIPSPSEADPFQKPDEARKRRSVVIERMLEDGVITAAEKEAADREPLPDKPFFQQENVQLGQAEYFAEEVKQVLLRDSTLGATDAARYNKLFKGGLKIYTTFDPHLQNLATAAVNDTIPDDPPFTAAMTVVESQTGAVRAAVSGKNFFAERKYNLATQAEKSFGSAFKVLTLSTALSMGYSPYDQVDGRAPCILGRDRQDPSAYRTPGKFFRNAEGGGGAIMSLRSATVGSVNCAYMHLIEEVGPQNVSDMAVKMGFGDLSGLAPQDRDESCPCESMTLGAVNASTLDMASVMATLAAEGVHHEAYFVERIEDPTGKVVYQHNDPGERVLDRNVALTVQDIMSDAVCCGTGTRARLAGGRDVSGKTGTDDNFKNAAFIGFTKHYSVAVWMGDPDTNETTMFNVGGITVYGGTYPAMIFKAFMDPAHESIPIDDDTYEDPDLSVYRGGKRVGFFSALPERTPDPSPSPSPSPTESPSPSPSPPPADSSTTSSSQPAPTTSRPRPRDTTTTTAPENSTTSSTSTSTTTTAPENTTTSSTSTSSSTTTTTQPGGG